MAFQLYLRYGLGLLGGFLVTVMLLYIMQAVIHSDENPLNEASQITLLEFHRVLEDEVPEIKDLKPKPPPPPDEAPPDMPKPDFDSATNMGVDIGSINPEVDIDMSGGGFSSDGEYLPIVKVLPQYPRRALSRGIEGYVIVEFCVTEQGTVRDPVVIEAEPSAIFDRAAMNAALKFKYKPKVVNEVAVEVCGVPNKITFEMEDG
ncbi:MAG: energy transducer TonB [Gammaproteobacteria bacterium]|nr:energy transducer TonB [Gammaproteobacteria bacterium]